LEKHDDLIRIVRTLTLDVVNFRFEPKAFDDNNVKITEVFNNELVADVKQSEIVVPLTPYIRQKLYIQVVTVSH
jgi:hypothetical protein